MGIRGRMCLQANAGPGSALRAGARDVLAKPMRTDRLLAVVDRLLETDTTKSRAVMRQR